MPIEHEIREICGRVTPAQAPEESTAVVAEPNVAIRGTLEAGKNRGIHFSNEHVQSQLWL